MTRLTTSKPNSHAHRGFYVGRSLLVLALAFALPNHNSFATDADWNEDPVSGDWDTAANWTPAVVPDGTATFGVSNITNISISRNPTSVEVIYFQTEASVYTFTVSPGSALLITRGLTNIYRYNQNLVCEGSTDIGTPGGLLEFSGESSANGFALTASGGENGGPGGVIRFQDQTTSYNSFVTLSGNATLDISALTGPYGVQIGSLTGSYSLGGAGIVNLGSNELTVGDNNRGCYFEGIIQDGPNGSGGSLRKVGNANLQLAGSNTYTGETIVEQGALVVLTNGGSGTGSGPVTVHPQGVLAGGGFISGSVTIGRDGYLDPNHNLYRVGKTLSIGGSLTLAVESTYHCNYLGRWTDTVSANGITIDPNARIELVARHPRATTVGTVYTILSNTSDTAINGTFGNLPDGKTFFEAGNVMQVSYEGGDGNDLTLTVLKSRDGH